MAGLNKNLGLVSWQGGGGGATYPFTFATGDLVDGVLTVTHNLSTNYPKPLLRRPDDTYEEPYNIMTFIDTNSVSFDFGGSIDAGTWNGLIGI